MTRDEKELREEIIKLTREYYDVAFPEKTFLGGISQVPVSGKVFDAEEMKSLIARVPSRTRSLERVADHATNIAEEVVYLYEARDIRHSKAKPHEAKNPGR